METIRQIGKNLKKTKKGSDFAIERTQLNFPVIEKVYDFIAPEHPFEAEFKTYFPDDQAYLTVQIKPDIIGVPARHICTAIDTDYDALGGRLFGPTFVAPVPPPNCEISVYGSHPPVILDRVPNSGISWGIASTVYVGNGLLTHGAKFTFNLGSPKVICRLMLMQGSLFGFYTGEFTILADGAPLLVPTQNVLYYLDYVEAQTWTVEYFAQATLPDTGWQYYFKGGADTMALLIWEAEFE